MWTQTKYTECMTKLYERAAVDKNFRRLCLTSPADAVKEVSGLDLPDGVKLKFVENAPEEQVYVLPAPLWNRSELSEQEINNVLSVAVLWIVSGTPGAGFFIYRVPPQGAKSAS